VVRFRCATRPPTESFWGTHKQELVHHRRYQSRQEAIQDITEYIEIFYKGQRKQARLGFCKWLTCQIIFEADAGMSKQYEGRMKSLDKKIKRGL